MARRVLDIFAAIVGLLLTAPVLALAALAIPLASPGPILHRARRAGIHGRTFTLYKLRTMHVRRGDAWSPVTARNDPRVFRLGRWLRTSKIDELPQLWNVLRGDMAVVGPRPEDPEIVARHYSPAQLETLSVRPGLTSPGTLYHEAGASAVVEGTDAAGRYVERVLPVKLAIDLVYIRDMSLKYDLAVIARTIAFFLARLMGMRSFPHSPELQVVMNAMRSTTPAGDTGWEGAPGPSAGARIGELLTHGRQATWPR